LGLIILRNSIFKVACHLFLIFILRLPNAHSRDGHDIEEEKLDHGHLCNDIIHLPSKVEETNITSAEKLSNLESAIKTAVYNFLFDSEATYNLLSKKAPIPTFVGPEIGLGLNTNVDLRRSENPLKERSVSISSLDVEVTEQKINLDDVFDVEMGLKAERFEISTQTTPTTLIEESTKKKRMQYMQAICLASYIHCMNKFWGITLSLLSIGELLFPVVGLYFIGLNNSFQNQMSCISGGNYQKGVFCMTAGLVCTTLKRSSAIFLILRKQILDIYKNKKNEESKASMKTDDGHIDEILSVN
jgi:hypothetical protein